MTVSELTRHIRHLFDKYSALQGVWIIGETSNWRDTSSGHAYFTLKDEGAQIRCVMFRSWRRRLRFEPGDGQRVRVHGSISIYEQAGNYQLYADEMTEPDGWGDLYRRFEELKERLSKEGLFDASRKRPIPLLPRRVGVVTSPTGAAIRDVIHVIRRRYPSMDVLLFPALVQGSEAPASIVRSLEEANRVPDVDVLIVGRGGGSFEELWAFNDERVVRALAASRVPVIAGVGHEVDFTLTDAVADYRAPTPSAAAERAVPVKTELAERVSMYAARLARSLRQGVLRRREQLSALARAAVLREPQMLVRSHGQRVDELELRLRETMRRKEDLLRRQLASFAAQLEALSPLAVLERGYAVVRNGQGAVVLRAEQTAIGETISVRLFQGALQADVTEITRASADDTATETRGPVRAANAVVDRTEWEVGNG